MRIRNLWTSWFTLIELIIAATIFSMMSIVILSTYIQMTGTGARLRHVRYLAETSREITERIADDVRQNGISISLSKISGLPYIPWQTPSYALGSEVLAIGSESSVKRLYIYGQRIPTGIRPCDATLRSAPSEHCGLYMVPASTSPTGVVLPNYADAVNLVDSFVPEESRKRVKLSRFSFFLSGDGETTEKKVTLSFEAVLMPRVGVPPALMGDARLPVQTTLSERFFKE